MAPVHLRQPESDSGVELASLLLNHLSLDAPLAYEESLQDDTNPQIRILWLEPAAFREPIQCRLEAVPLATAPPFEALSYCWGPTDPEVYIHVDASRIHVTPNLKIALYRLRLRDAPRPLWVDAICINQQDIPEKSSQVRRMRDIYVKAHKTVVWLGEEEDDSRLALDMCARTFTAHGEEHFRQAYLIDIKSEYERWRTQVIQNGMTFNDEVIAVTAFANQFDMDAAIMRAGYKYGYDSVKGTADQTALDVAEVKKEAMAELVEEIIEKEAKYGVTGIDPSDPVEYFKELGKLFVRYRDQGLKWSGPFRELIDEGDPLLDGPAGETGGDATEAVQGEAGAMSVLKEAQVGNRQDGTIGNGEVTAGPYARAVEYLLKSTAVPYDAHEPTSEEAKAIHKLFERPWFRRIWIVQEAAVSRTVTVQCGAHEIDWWVFAFGYEIASKLKRNIRIGPKYHSNFTTMSRLRSTLSLRDVDWKKSLGTDEVKDADVELEELQLLKLLMKYRRYLATDPRDKVFALLGLTNSNLDQLDVRPDYALPVRQVYTDVARTLLEHTGYLDVLAIPRSRTDNPSTSLPSWVPDWTDVHSQPYLLSDKRESQDPNDAINTFRSFTASKDTKATVVVEDDRLLHVSGYAMDSIVQIGGIMDITDHALAFTMHDSGKDGLNAEFWGMLNEVLDGVSKDADVLNGWTKLAGISNKRYRYPGTGEDAFTVFARTVYTDTDKKTYLSDCKDWIEQFETLGKQLKRMPRFDLDNLEPSIIAAGSKMKRLMKDFASAKMQNIGRRSCVHTLYRRLARTHKGYLALVPATTVIDDQIALLHGGRTPYILRQSPSGYQLVGESYVHGIMYGEAWNSAQCHTITIS